MIFAIAFLVCCEMFSLTYIYKAWIKPAIVARATWPFEPGPDDAVSWREMMRRSVWRYDSWMDRIMSLAGLFTVNAFVVIAILVGR